MATSKVAEEDDIATLSSSGLASESIHHLFEAVGIFNHLVPVADSIQVEGLLSSAIPQNKLSQKLDNHFFSSRLEASTIANRARLLWSHLPMQPPGFQYHLVSIRASTLIHYSFRLPSNGGLVWTHLVVPSVQCVQKKALILLAIL